MADKNISTLPAVESIDNDSLFVAEQQGVASKVTGAQVASFAKEAANANVQAAVDAAKKSARGRRDRRSGGAGNSPPAPGERGDGLLAGMEQRNRGL